MTFRFRPALALCTLAGLAVLVSLGTWQLKRLEWKRALIARVDARVHSAPIPLAEALSRAADGENMEYQPVRVRGAYVDGLSVRVFGTYAGAAGFYVFTPLKTANSGGAPYVFINRGFVPQSIPESELAKGRIKSETEVEGLLRAPEMSGGPFAFLRPKDQPQDDLYFRRDPVQFAAAKSIAAASSYIDGSGRENPAAWPKGGTTAVEFPNRHLEYALTWFGLAAALAGVYVAFSIRRG